MIVSKVQALPPQKIEIKPPVNLKADSGNWGVRRSRRHLEWKIQRIICLITILIKDIILLLLHWSQSRSHPSRQDERRLMNFFIIVPTELFLLLIWPTTQWDRNIARSILATDHEANLSRGISTSDLVIRGEYVGMVVNAYSATGKTFRQAFLMSLIMSRWSHWHSAIVRFSRLWRGFDLEWWLHRRRGGHRRGV